MNYNLESIRTDIFLILIVSMNNNCPFITDGNLGMPFKFILKELVIEVYTSIRSLHSFLHLQPLHLITYRLLMIIL